MGVRTFADSLGSRSTWIRFAPVLVVALLATACPRDNGTQDTSSTDTTLVSRATDSSSATTTPDNTTTGPDRTPDTSTPSGEAGSAGLGDPLFPQAGNGGYDVLHYRIELDTTGPELVGQTTIEALVTQDLRSLNLDLIGLNIDEVSIDGTIVETARDGRELTLTPPEPMANNSVITIDIAYHGEPQPVPDPAFPTILGWIDEPWGSYVASEPLGAATWFPGNDHPLDKATFEIIVTVDEGEIAAGPGLLVSQVDGPDGTTFTWLMDDPMATYLASVVVGDFTMTTSEITTEGRETPVVLRDVLPTDRSDEVMATIEGRHAAMIAEFERIFGPYPYDSYGVVGVPEDLSYALENQTLSLFGVDFLASNTLFAEQVQAHELAHQWFGNHVSPATWGDIWLNEGFASWADLYWTGIVAGQDQFQRTAGTFADAGLGPLTDVTPGTMFDTKVYIRGALTLEALRRTEGDEAFFAFTRAWANTHGGAAATTDDFYALVGEQLGPSAEALARSWVEDDQMPDLPGS